MAQPTTKPQSLLGLGLIVEGGMAVVALGLAWFGFFEKNQLLSDIPSYSSEIWLSILGWGIVATLPMLAYLLVFHFWRPAFFRPMQQFVEAKLKPIFKNSSLLELLALSLMAGFGEELFFRWCLQGGITSVLENQIGSMPSIVVGVVVASIIFGGCHWVNASYGITTMIVGAYLGMTMVWTSSWMVPAIAHALFDFVALIYIARWPSRRSQPSVD